MHNLNDGITVVIPTYNSEKFINRTLKSLEDQIEIPNEIIFSDDGSSDGTIEIIELWEKNNPRFKCKIFKNAHKGPGNARNIGIKNSKNNWIAFLDSDDTWNKDKIYEIKKVISSNFKVNFIVHFELFENQKGFRQEISQKLKIFENSKKNLKEFLYNHNIFSTSAVVCNKYLLEQKGLFDVNLPNGQDYDLWLKLAPEINLFIIKKNLGVYYDTLNNITSRYYLKRIKSELIICFRYKNYVHLTNFFLKLIKILISKNWFRL